MNLKVSDKVWSFYSVLLVHLRDALKNLQLRFENETWKKDK